MGSQNCVYCGSPSKGRGCQLNPIGIHDPVGSEITPLPQDPRRNSSSGNTSEQHLDNDSDSGGQSNYDPATQETLDRAGGSMRERCALLLKNPQHIALQIGGGFLLAGCCIWFVWHATPDPTWRLVGSTLSIVLGYFFRNVLAVVLARSWFGLPAVLAGLGVRHFIDVDAGNIVILGALALWIWPVWPFAVLLLLAFAAAAPALSRAGGAKLYGGK